VSRQTEGVRRWSRMTSVSTACMVYLTGLVLLVGCGNEPAAPPPPVASVEVTPSTAGVVIGQTVQLTARVKDAVGNELTDRQVTWTSNAPTQATVSSAGLVTGLALSDTVVITATSEGMRSAGTISVVFDIAGEWNFTEQLIVVVPVSPSLGVGVTCSDTGSYRFTQSGADIAGTKSHVGTCLGQPGVWAPVGSWDNTALPFPITAGRLTSTRIRFGDGSAGCLYEGDVILTPTPKLTGTYSCPIGSSGTWEATPGGAPVASVAVRWDAQTVVGGAVVFVAVDRDAVGHVLSRPVTWSGDNPSVAIVSDDGLVDPRAAGSAPITATLVYARAAGSARITATSEGKAGSATVTADLVTFGSVSAGGGHSCAVRPTGSAYCWGWGGDGQLGTGFRPPAGEPLASAETPRAVAGGHAFALVSAGVFHTCGVTPTGEAYCWGDNASGQLGDGSTTSSLFPVRVTGGRPFASVTVGFYHSCGVTTANDVYCWGNNEWGQLGSGGFSFSPSSSPVLVASGLLFQAVRAGLYHTCGVTTTNEAYCWGYGHYGQLGTGSYELAVATPVAVAGGHSFVAVAAGFTHSCAVSSDGGAYCWGAGSLLGDGSGLNQLEPVQVAGGPFAMADGALAAGEERTCALTPAGAAYCWGHNDLGGLGDGSTIDRATPVQVSGGVSFATISVGTFHTCGITTGAVAFCWGNNADGQLGADAPESCAINGRALPCATVPVRVIGQPGAATAGSLRVEGRMQRAAAEPSRLLRALGPGLWLPAPSLPLPRR
jgi:alpha-tubulin suppressor-like RCC1 family protein